MGTRNEQAIWDKLKSFGFNDFAVAGIMGNLKAESNLESTNLQNSYNTILRMTDEEYTLAVDERRYISFITDKAGYGLAQWTYWSRKAQLLLFAQKKGTSIGDADMQLEYLFTEIKNNYPSLYKELKNCESINDASDAILKKYERPADMGQSVVNLRRKYSQSIYLKHHKDGDSSNVTFEIGSIVEIEACDMYISSLGTSPYKCKSGYCTITQFATQGLHQYHVIRIKGSNSNAYGWIDKKHIIKTVKSVDDIAKEVIAGKWGNGVERKEALADYGLDYKIIQSRVNEMMKRGE